jgi:hypothetical protein
MLLCGTSQIQGLLKIHRVSEIKVFVFEEIELFMNTKKEGRGSGRLQHTA